MGDWPLSPGPRDHDDRMEPTVSHRDDVDRELDEANLAADPERSLHLLGQVEPFAVADRRRPRPQASGRDFTEPNPPEPQADPDQPHESDPCLQAPGRRGPLTPLVGSRSDRTRDRLPRRGPIDRFSGRSPDDGRHRGLTRLIHRLPFRLAAYLPFREDSDLELGERCRQEREHHHHRHA